MSDGSDVALERASESGVFCGPVKKFVPVRGEYPAGKIRMRSQCEVSIRTKRETQLDSQRIIGMLGRKDSNTHRSSRVSHKYAFVDEVVETKSGAC